MAERSNVSVRLVTLEDIQNDPEIDTYVCRGNEYLHVLGYTEHGYRHLNLVAQNSHRILAELGYNSRLQELAAIAGYLHDLGNVISRYNHGETGALLAFQVLKRLGMEPEEIGIVIAAIGNHEEEYGYAVNEVAAALILADKSDVHRSRVRNPDFATFDIHDRVNYAVEKSLLAINAAARKITMDLTIDVNMSTVMEYFEIFLTRMVMCRRAASFLNCTFGLIINGAQLL